MVFHKDISSTTSVLLPRATLKTLKSSRRIVVLGAPGSGKSMFSSQLARVLCLPYVALDDLYWGENWTRPANEVFLQRLTHTLQDEEWVLDGNYHHTYLDERICRADTIILLDVPTSIALRGLISRSLKRYFGERSSLPRNVAIHPDYRPAWELRPKLFWLTCSFKLRIRPLLLQKLQMLADEKCVIMLASHKSAKELLIQLAEVAPFSAELNEWRDNEHTK